LGKSKIYLLSVPRRLNSAHLDGSNTSVGGLIPELSFIYPNNLDQFVAHLAVYDQF